MTFADPFDVTKAVDYRDEEIENTWVRLPGQRPESWPITKTLMPKFLVGAKGGGRTHLLRHVSFALQCYRAEVRKVAVLDELRQAGYVGLYMRCGGLNSSRFAGKRIEQETWISLFAYYSDLSFAVLCLDAVCTTIPEEVGAAASAEIALLLNPPLALEEYSLGALRAAMLQELRSMDVAINNVALSHVLDITIRSTPGTLVFGLPEIVARTIPAFSAITFFYLVDEFENLTLEQQRYVNTLIREREGPASFVVGSRRFGIRTHQTMSGGEENRPGSEFDEIVPEDDFRASPTAYASFCRNLIRRRLLAAGESEPADIRALFQEYAAEDHTWSQKVLPILDGKVGLERPWMNRLLGQLRQVGMPREDVASVVRLLSSESQPLLEKYGILLFYRAWHSSRGPTVDAAARARSSVREVEAGDASAGVSFAHYREDLYAQARYSLRLDVDYFGLDNIIQMSGYIPRNLLITIKKIYKWAAFETPNDQTPLPFSISAQRQGIGEAADWFFSDSKALGQIGESGQVVLRRTGSFLRALRFSDKPVEVSAATVAVNRRSLNEEARETLDTCVQHGQLVELPHGHKMKNREGRLYKYQINPMLAPKFDLPINRRGVVQLSDQEASVLFDPYSDEAAMREILGGRTRSLNVPFGGVGASEEEGLF
jgi:hypothetical protein